MDLPNWNIDCIGLCLLGAMVLSCGCSGEPEEAAAPDALPTLTGTKQTSKSNEEVVASQGYPRKLLGRLDPAKSLKIDLKHVASKVAGNRKANATTEMAQATIRETTTPKLELQRLPTLSTKVDTRGRIQETWDGNTTSLNADIGSMRHELSRLPPAVPAIASDAEQQAYGVLADPAQVSSDTYGKPADIVSDTRGNANADRDDDSTVNETESYPAGGVESEQAITSPVSRLPEVPNADPAFAAPGLGSDWDTSNWSTSSNTTSENLPGESQAETTIMTNSAPSEFSNPELTTPDQPASTANVPDVSVQVPGMRSVNMRAEAMLRHAFTLAQRGAHYSARAELIDVLRMVGEALDMQSNSRQHSDALSNGFKAMEEARDFQQRGLTADLDLKILIAGHQTPVLKNQDLSITTPLIALQRYYTYAQEQLANAGGGQATSSVAFFGLGQLTAFTGSEAIGGLSPETPAAMVFHQAAIMVNPMNYKAANELGVLLARYGQYAQARSALLHSVSVSSQPESWSNLAVVHTHLGEQSLANQARRESRLVANHQGSASDSLVRWVDPAALAGTIDTARSESPRTANDEFRSPAQAAAQPVSSGETQGLMRFIPWLRRSE